MNLSKTIVSAGLCLTSIFAAQSAYAGFLNNGIMQQNNLNISVAGTLDNSGKLLGNESAKIVCETFTGNGTISAPVINIQTNIFAFNGTIECSKKCLIITSSPFNEKMFTRKGKGEFVIIVDKKANIEAFNKMKSFSGNHEYFISDEEQLLD